METFSRQNVRVSVETFSCPAQNRQTSMGVCFVLVFGNKFLFGVNQACPNFCNLRATFEMYIIYTVGRVNFMVFVLLISIKYTIDMDIYIYYCTFYHI